MKGKRFVCALLLALLMLPIAARADVLLPGMKPPRNEQSEAFVALYQKELLGWDDAYYNATAGENKLVLWRYPGSGQVTRVINVDCPRELELCYRDSEGRYWGYLSYIVGNKLNWVCLSDPTNENLPADPTVIAAVNREVPLMLLRENLPAILLVTGIVAVTGALIYVFWFRKKKAA